MRYSLKNLLGFVKKPARRFPVRNRSRLSVEALEDRTLLSTFFVALGGSDSTPNGSNPATPFRSVQAAINAATAAPGADVIKVAAGTYNDPTFDQNISIPSSASLQLLGGWDSTFTTQNPRMTVYIPQNPGSTGTYDVQVDNPGTTIDGFYFVFDGTQGVGGTRQSGGVLADSSGFVFNDNTVEIGVSGSGRSTGLQTTSVDQTGLTITDNTFIAEQATVTNATRAHGIFLNPDPVHVTPNVISGNIFTGNNLTSALIVDRVGNLDFVNNTVTRVGDPGTGFQLIDFRTRNTTLFPFASGTPLSNVLIQGNTLDGGGTGTGIIFSDVANADQGISGVTVSNNIIRNFGGDGIAVGPGAAQLNAISFTLHNNSFSGNAVNIFRSATSPGGSSTIDASGNWWGTAIGANPTDSTAPMAIDASIQDGGAVTGTLLLGSFLSNGTNTATVGFTPATTTEMWVPQTKATSGLHFVDGSIQAGIDSATAGMTVRVAADTFNEDVSLNKSITLLGAQAGVDARTGRPAAPETLLIGTGVNAPIVVGTNNVTLDGFTIESPGSGSGALGGGVYLPGVTGILIQNNIVQNNTSGLVDVGSSVTAQFNLIQDNNAPGAGGGNGIEFVSGSTGTWNINHNRFTGNGNAEILVATGGAAINSLTVDQNDFVSSASSSFTAYSPVAALVLSGNTVTSSAVTAFALNGGIANALITGNTFTNGQSRAIYVHDAGYGAGPNSNVTITGNTINQDVSLLAGSRSMIDLTDLTGTNTVSGNTVNLTGTVGGPVAFVNAISVHGAVPGTMNITGNTFNGGNVDTFNGIDDSAGIRLAGDLPATAVVNIDNNKITGFVDGIAADTLASGITVTARLNSIGGNSASGVVNGSGATINASGNWWGTSVGANPSDSIAPNAIEASINASSGSVFVGSFLNSGANTAAVGFTPAVATEMWVPKTKATTGLIFVDGSIQAGIDSATAGMTVRVAADTYKQNVTVNKPLTLLGANAGVLGSGTRSTESVVVGSGPLATSSPVFTISANGVTIDGFTVDGDDPTMNSGHLLTSGDDADTFFGIRVVGGAFSGLNIQNNIIKHVFIGFRGDGLSSNNLITRNWFDSIGAFDFGYAVDIRNSFYADVTDNLMTRVQSGLHVNLFSASGPATWLFQDNTVSTYGAGVWDNGGDGSATPLTINHNTFTSLVAPNTAANAALFSDGIPVRDHYDGKATGIMVVSVQGSVGVNITNNSITGMGYGVIFFSTTAPLTLGGTNTISGNGVGVYLTNIVGFNPVTSTILGGAANNPTATTSVTLSGTTLTNNTTGILVRGDNPSSAFGASLTIGTGVTITGGTTGIEVTGPATAVSGNTLNNLVFSGQSGQYILLFNAALAGQELDAASVVFGGVTGAAATLAQNFAIEDKITHAVDDGTLGFVRVEAGNVFVTPNSFVLPATTTPSIQRGINAASAGDTVTIGNGTYLGSNITVTKALTIAGESQTGVIVAPDVADVNDDSSFGGAFRHGFIVQANNVTIQDLTIDGNGNALLPPGQNYRAGIITDFTVGNFSGLTVQDTTVKNIFRRGIQVSTGGTGNLITGNTVTNVSGAAGAVGIAVFGGDTIISNNQITNSADAIAANADLAFPQDPLLTITGNTLTGNLVGMNLAALATGSIIGGPNATDANAIDMTTSATADIGILVSFSQGLVTIQGNTITGSGGDAGVWLFRNEFQPVFVVGNQITTTGSTQTNPGEGDGIFLSDDPTPFGENDTGIGLATIQGNTITGFVNGIDLERIGTVNTGPKDLTVTIGGTGAGQGNHITGFGTGSTGIRLVDGNGPAAGNINATIQGNDFHTAEFYIFNQAPGNIDATTDTFDVTDNFAIEDKIFHKIDNAASGLVTWVANNIFVNPAASPTATNNDFTRINNAVGAASNNFTITLQGNFNWNEANAAASYAASIPTGPSTFGDIRGVELPDGVNNLTITSAANNAHIIGRGDFEGAIFDTFIFANDSTTATGNVGAVSAIGNNNLTIENLNIDDFESAYTEGWNSTGTFNNTKIQNNVIIVAGDGGADGNDASNTQNIAIYFWVGTNQHVTGNTIQFEADGTRTVGTGARSFGFQNGTSGGTAYDGLLIDSNTFQFANSSPGTETVYGIRENSQSDDNNAHISITNNQFLGIQGRDFDRALMLTSQTTGLLIDGNHFTDVDDVLFSRDSSGGTDPGDRFTFTNNVLTRVGGADGIFLQNVTTDPTPTHVVVNWATNNTIDGETGIRGLNELSTQATQASRPLSAASDISVVNAIGANPVTYVDASWATTPRFADPDGIGSGIDPLAFGFNAFATVHEGVAAVDGGGTVHIYNGNYFESNLVIDKAVTIQGQSQAGVIVGPSIVDGHLDLSSFGPTVSNGFVIQHSDVTIETLTLDGDANTSLPGTQNYRAGIVTDFNVGNYNNTIIDSVTFKNIFRRAVTLRPMSAHSTGNVITNNTFDSIGTDNSLGFESAFAILTFSSDAQIVNNVITNSGGGIGSNNLFGPTGAMLLTITGNNISSPANRTPGSLGMDLAGLASGSVVSDNAVDTTGGTTHDLGIIAQYMSGNVTIETNTVTAGAGDTGFYLYHNSDSTNPLLLQDNTITTTTGGSNGILLSNDGSPFGDVIFNTNYAHIFDNTITGFATGVNLIGNDFSATQITCNHITGNTVGLNTNSPASVIDAKNNWWGSPTGPTNAANPGGMGDSVVEATAGTVDFTPFLLTPECVVGLSVTAPAGASTGFAFTITVTANDPFGAPGTEYTGTVHLSSSDGSAVLPGDYTFLPSDHGVRTFTVTLLTGGSQTITATDTGTAALTGSATVLVNNTPVANPDGYSVNENGSVFVSTTGSLGSGVLANDTDLDNDSLSAILVTSVTHGSLYLSPNGTFFYMPNAGYSGPDSFTYKANDGIADSNVTTVSLTVNALPVANNDSFTVLRASTNNSLDVLANDTGTSLSVTGVSLASHGTVSIAPGGGGLTYTPTPGFSGVDNFTYTITNATGGTATASVAIQVSSTSASNHPPVANPDVYTVNENGFLIVSTTGSLGNGVLANDTDQDNDPLNAVLVSNVTHGSLFLLPNGTFIYTPTAGYTGPDSFTYKANDGSVDSTTNAIVSLTVNALPVANSDSFTVAQDSLANSLPVLTNDTGASLSVTSVSAASHGTVVIAPGGGSLTYTPTGGFSGIDNFSYTITNASGGTATAFVTVQVTPTNVAPVINAPASAVILANQVTALSGITVTDSDAGTGMLKVTLSASSGTLTLGSLAGLSFSSGTGIADSSMTFTGTLININIALSGLTYGQPTDSSSADAVNILVDDQGNTGAGGNKTANASITINPAYNTAQLLPDPFKAGTKALVVNGTPGSDIITVKPKGASTTTYIVTINTTTFTVTGVTGRILVFGQDGNDTITLSSAVTRRTWLSGGNGDDTITGGSGPDWISGGAGHNLLNGGAGVDRLVESGNVDFTLIGGTARTNGTLTSGLGVDTIFRTSIETAQLTGGAGNNTIDTTAFNGNVTLDGGAGDDIMKSGRGNDVLIGGDGNDTLSGGLGSNILDGGAGNNTMIGANANSTWSITANNAGKAAYAVGATVFTTSFSNMQNLTGGTLNDTFKFSNGKSVSGAIDGGTGINTLNYAAYTAAVTVNLLAGTASPVDGGLVGGINNIANAVGGAGNDILVGNASNNVLVGGAGRDILIGGAGKDILNGGAGDDILIGGTLTDSSPTNLNAIMALWIAPPSYSTRIGSLGTLLNSTTVQNDAGAVDALTGSTGLDWFITSAGDVVTDKNNGGVETRTIV